MENKNILYQYKNGNTLVTLLHNGTKIREYEDTPISDFPESIDIKITNYCDLGCSFCHESSTTKGVHGDLNKLITTLTGLPKGTEIAIGGGNPLDHPELLNFLNEVKELGLVPNITINQGHVLKHIDLITHLIEDKLVYGVGISLTSNNWKGVDKVMEITENVVFHIILGIHNHSILSELKEKYGSPKVLLLGYKVWGFGKEYYSEEIEKEIKKWYQQLSRYFGKMIISFDNLAIEQLNLKRFFSPVGWEKFYMGDDFKHTMYIDAVKQEYSPTSRSGERVSFNDMDLLTYFKTRL